MIEQLYQYSSDNVTLVLIAALIAAVVYFMVGDKDYF